MTAEGFLGSAHGPRHLQVCSQNTSLSHADHSLALGLLVGQARSLGPRGAGPGTGEPQSLPVFLVLQ